MTDSNPHIHTNSGIKFHFMKPNINEMNIEDIAHSLSMKCRWNGHIDTFYSVAQHSLQVSEYVKEMGASPLYVFEGLLHDMAEAYTVDMPTPLKNVCKEFQDIENNLYEAMAIRFGVPAKISHYTKLADRMALICEAGTLFKIAPSWLKDEYTTSSEAYNRLNNRFHIRPMTSKESRDAFLIAFDKLSAAIYSYEPNYGC